MHNNGPPILQVLQYLHCILFCFRSTTWLHILEENNQPNDKQKIKKLMEYKQKGSNIHATRIMDLLNFYHLKHYNQTAIIHILQTYFKVLAVRHPLDRFLSGYEDKFVTSKLDTVFEGLGRHIMEEMHPGIGHTSIMTRKSVTLQDLVKYAIKHEDIENGHFLRMYKLCHPCVINYDYISKLETQSVDASFIIKNYLSDKGTYAMKKDHRVTGGATTWKALPSYNSISTNDINDLKALFELDMQLFGYSIDYDKNRTMIGHCGMFGEKNDCC